MPNLREYLRRLPERDDGARKQFVVVATTVSFVGIVLLWGVLTFFVRWGARPAVTPYASPVPSEPPSTDTGVPPLENSAPRAIVPTPVPVVSPTPASRSPEATAGAALPAATEASPFAKASEDTPADKPAAAERPAPATLPSSSTEAPTL